MNDCVERFDTQIYRVEKKVKELIDNLRLSPYHRKELQMKGREIETIVKNANLQIEENIMKAFMFSSSKLIDYLNTFNKTLLHDINNLPKYKDDVLKHQNALLQNLKILKEKLHNSNNPSKYSNIFKKA